jgi:hypothetical protein
MPQQVTRIQRMQVAAIPFQKTVIAKIIRNTAFCPSRVKAGPETPPIVLNGTKNNE